MGQQELFTLAVAIAGVMIVGRAVARLRAVGQGGPFLLKTEMEAGHGGRSGRYDAWREEALVLAWVVETAGGAPSG